jgi:hypothetical protein
VRQVTFAIFLSPVRLGVEERTVAWLLTFGRLVGSAAGHFRDFSFTGSARCRRANGRVVVNIWG